MTADASRIFIPPDSRERYLHAAGRGSFQKMGIEMAGLSRLTKGYFVERKGYPVHVLLITLGGRVLLELPHLKTWLNPGQMILLPAGSSYAYRVEKQWNVLWFHFYDQAPWKGFFQAEAEIRKSFALEELKEIAERFLKENLRRNRADAGLVLDGLARVLGLYLQRELQTETDVSQKEDRARVESLWQKVEADLGHPWNIQSLSREAGWSRTKLMSVVHHFYQCGAMSFVTRLRMEHAAQMLLGSSVKIAAVAQWVGYENEFAFSKAFKRQMGKPPREYRAP